MAKDNLAGVVSSTKKSGTVIVSHNCPNKFMDERYGFNMRVMNVMAAGTYRCVACGQVKK